MAPNCECHAVPMLWSRDHRYRAGGFWRCRIRKATRQRERYAHDPEARLDRQLRNMARIRIVN